MTGTPTASSPATTSSVATTARWFRYVAIVETISWLLLIVATVVKYTADQPIGVKILGPIHGALFIAYVLLALSLFRPLQWSARTLLVILVEAVIPGGGFFAARREDLAPRPDETTAPA